LIGLGLQLDLLKFVVGQNVVVLLAVQLHKNRIGFVQSSVAHKPSGAFRH
jgi:hypothetical protein